MPYVWPSSLMQTFVYILINITATFVSTIALQELENNAHDFKVDVLYIMHCWSFTPLWLVNIFVLLNNKKAYPICHDKHRNTVDRKWPSVLTRFYIHFNTSSLNKVFILCLSFLKFMYLGTIDKKSALVQVMAWYRRTLHKPFFVPTMTQINDA